MYCMVVNNCSVELLDFVWTRSSVILLQLEHSLFLSNRFRVSLVAPPIAARRTGGSVSALLSPSADGSAQHRVLQFVDNWGHSDHHRSSSRSHDHHPARQSNCLTSCNDVTCARLFLDNEHEAQRETNLCMCSRALSALWPLSKSDLHKPRALL